MPSKGVVLKRVPVKDIPASADAVGKSGAVVCVLRYISHLRRLARLELSLRHKKLPPEESHSH